MDTEREREKRREIEIEKIENTGDRRSRGRERVSRGSHPREKTPGRVCIFGEGESATATVVILRAFYKSGHNKRHVHATTVGTILRPIGRPCANIMAPLSCGASTPTSTSASVPHHYPEIREGVRVLPPRRCCWSSLLPILLSFVLHPPSSVRRDDQPLTPPAFSQASRPSSLPRPLPPTIFVLLFFPSWSPRATLRVSEMAPRRFLQRATRVQRRASGAHRWLLPFTLKGLGRDAEGSFLSRERLALLPRLPPFTLIPPLLSPFCARRGGNRVQLKLRSRAHRPR